MRRCDTRSGACGDGRVFGVIGSGILDCEYCRHPTKRYPPFSVGRIYEHNDEELPEPDRNEGIE